MLHGLSIPRVQLAKSPMVDSPGVWGKAIDELRSSGIEVASGMLATIGEDYATLDTIRRTGGVVPDDPRAVGCRGARRFGPGRLGPLLQVAYRCRL
jgi:hypothetical protein